MDRIFDLYEYGRENIVLYVFYNHILIIT